MTSLSTWPHVNEPLLRTVRDNENLPRQASWTLRDLMRMAELDCSPVQALNELKRMMESGLLAGEMFEYPGAGKSDERALDSRFPQLRIGAEGARRLGMWPSDDPIEEILRRIESKLEDPSLDEDTRSRLTKISDGIKGLSADVGKALLARVIIAGMTGELDLF